MATVRALQDGEFGVSLNDSIQPEKFEGKEEIEVISKSLYEYCLRNQVDEIVFRGWQIISDVV